MPVQGCPRSHGVPLSSELGSTATARTDPVSTIRSVLTASPFMAFIPVSDLAIARSFYAEILGLEVEAENPFAVILNSGGTMLRLTQVENHQPQPFTIAGWEVPDIGTTVEGLVS